MKDSRPLDTRFRHLTSKIVGFVLVPLLLLGTAIYFIGVENDLFRPRSRLVFTVPKGTGFSRGMPVKLSGFRIGRLSDIRLNDEAKVDVYVDIDRSFMKWVREDSVIRLVREGIVGESVLEVTVGSPSREILKDGGRIRYEHVKTLEELATEVTEKVTPVLLEVREIISYVNDPQGEVKRLVRNLNTLSDRLDRTLSGIDLLVSDLRERTGPLLDDARHTIAKVDPLLSQTEEALLTLNASLPPILQSAQNTLSTAERIGGSLEKGSGTLLPRIPRLMESAESALDGTRELMDGARRIWPLSSTVPPPPPPFVPVRSHE